jgi:cytochrome o ubiquinol oxidase subunit 2
MAGMQTQLHLIADRPGVYAGRSAAFSGPGFSDMHFDTLATSRADFDAWIARAKTSPLALDKAAYGVLEQPSEKVPVALYRAVEPALFDDIVDQYMRGTPRDPVCGAASATLPPDHASVPQPAHTASES